MSESEAECESGSLSESAAGSEPQPECEHELEPFLSLAYFKFRVLHMCSADTSIDSAHVFVPFSCMICF